MPTALARPLLAVLLLLIFLPLGACGGGSGAPPAEVPDPPFLPPPSPDVRINTDPPGSELSVFPEICGAGNRVYAVWYDRRDGDTDVYFNRSLDGGATWLATDRRLDTDAPGAAGSNVPRICCDGDRVYVAWSDQRSLRSEIRFNRSLDAGATWLAEDVRLDPGDPDEGSSWNVDVACAGAEVWVVWQDSVNGEPDILFRRSSDAGTTWSPAAVRLDGDAAGAAVSEFPRIASTGGAVHVVWQDGRDGETDVYHRRSLDGGATWPDPDARLDTDEAGAAASRAPQLFCDGNHVVVAWSDARAGEEDVHANASSDGGATFFAEDRRLDTSPPGESASLVPRVTGRGADVWVVWEDFRAGLADVHVSASSDGGATWSLADRRVDTGPPGTASSFLPRLAVDGARLFCVWYDDREGAFDVLLSTSDDGGETWSAKEVRLDTDVEGAANSLAPAIHAAGGEARVVWWDQRFGPGDVLFNRAGG